MAEGIEGGGGGQLALWADPKSPSCAAIWALVSSVRFDEGHVMLVAAMNDRLVSAPVRDVVEAAAGHLLRTSDGEANLRAAERWRQFASFCQASGARSLGDVTPTIAEAYMVAYTSDGLPPSSSTVSGRRTHVRLLFNTLRRMGLGVGDPTLDIVVPPRDARTARPLTDEEVGFGRAAALATLVETRQPAIWAIAETGATTGEAAKVRWSDIDLEAGVISLGGIQGKSLPRSVPLTAWGLLQLRRRRGASDLAGLVTSAGREAEARRISTGEALSGILARAGLTATDIRPASIRGWAGQAVLASTGRIEAVARHLGCRSLDAAADIVHFRWRR